MAFDGCAFEVDEETKTQTSGLKIGQNLGLMDFNQMVDRLQFKDNPATNDQVEPLSGEQHSLIWDKNLLFLFDADPGRRQFMNHGLLINVLDKPRSQFPMHLNCRSDYPLC